jgi:hypothetical protein
VLRREGREKGKVRWKISRRKGNRVGRKEYTLRGGNKVREREKGEW